MDHPDRDHDDHDDEQDVHERSTHFPGILCRRSNKWKKAAPQTAQAAFSLDHAWLVGETGFEPATPWSRTRLGGIPWGHLG